ncbi:MAG: PaaI family thioesterase [Burkholderiaceae bacterium]
MTDPTSVVPEGFGPIFRSSPALDALGGFSSRGSGSQLEIGLLVLTTHANARGRLHGGVAATLADTGVGYLLAYAIEPPQRLLTVSLTVDYVSSAGVGDWIDVRIDNADSTGRLVFTAARLMRGEHAVARIRAVFSKVA